MKRSRFIEVTELLKLVKHKTRNKYELDVSCEGIVSVDKEHELVLLPPELEDEDVDVTSGPKDDQS